MPAQALAAAVLVSFAASGNRVDLKLDHGAAALTWYSPATFRFQRTLNSLGQTSRSASGLQAGQEPLATENPAQRTDFAIDELPAGVRIRSRILEVMIQRTGLLVSVARIGGDQLMRDLTEPVSTPGGKVSWERAMAPGVRYYGVDLSALELEMDQRGRAKAGGSPLISSAGYGEFQLPNGGSFDLSGPDRYRIEAPGVDYFFYYGPNAKKMLEEHHAANVAARCLGPSYSRFRTRPNEVGTGWWNLRRAVLSRTHDAVGACYSSPFDLDAYQYTDADVLRRVRQIGSLARETYHEAVPLSDFRNQLDSFFTTYEWETTEKGLPLWRPLPLQFLDDPESAHHADEFMLGDEMLVAPFYTPGDKRSLYLPPGIWTNLATNEELQGRRSIEIETKGLPVFARNGTIVPLDAKAGMALHYFPKLAAEFFILEKDANAWTQLHAAPAGDAMRLEIESKVARDYEWVVHHVDKPSAVGFEEQKYPEASSRDAMGAQGWFYDATQKNLHVRTRVEAAEDRVIHLRW